MTVEDQAQLAAYQLGRGQEKVPKGRQLGVGQRVFTQAKPSFSSATAKWYTGESFVIARINNTQRFVC